MEQILLDVDILRAFAMVHCGMVSRVMIQRSVHTMVGRLRRCARMLFTRWLCWSCRHLVLHPIVFGAHGDRLDIH